MFRKSRRASIWLALGSLAAFATHAATPPGQPRSGPGGSDCPHQQVTAKRYGSDAQGYWLFEPAAPPAASAPVIVFNHGWSAMDPHSYGLWIEHLVKRGNIVIYPLYQESLRTPVNEFTPNAIAAAQDAIKRLQTEPGHTKPELDKFAVAGHSMGGVVSANMAALWESAGLPRPRAVLCAEPGKTWGGFTAINVKLEDLSHIPKETLLLCLVGDSDNIVGTTDAKRIFRETTQIPIDNKNYVTLVSDAHGQPALKATHMAPVALGGSFGGLLRRGGMGRGGLFGADALDFYGTWKLLDALTDAAFYGKNRNVALGNTPEQRFMGLWSDGVPVKEMAVTTNP
jgi:hypothetical protein